VAFKEILSGLDLVQNNGQVLPIINSTGWAKLDFVHSVGKILCINQMGKQENQEFPLCSVVEVTCKNSRQMAQSPIAPGWIPGRS
jgi:ABC-type histidine transport system ATPase subunit